MTYHTIHVKFSGHPVSSPFEFIFHAHHIQGVDSIEDGGTQGLTTEDAASVSSLRHWSQLVFAPSVGDVVIPSVLHHLQKKANLIAIREWERRLAAINSLMRVANTWRNLINVII